LAQVTAFHKKRLGPCFRLVALPELARFVTMQRILLAVCLASILDSVRCAPYNEVEVLCALGKNSSGMPNIANWCQKWVGCIKTKASPGGSQNDVMKAWDPAPCEEICGTWPAMSAPEGKSAKAVPSLAKHASKLLIPTHPSGQQSSLSHLFREWLPTFLQSEKKNACASSCERFKKGLSSCVATILFEPGKVAAMGMPKKAKKAAAICTKRTTPCQPELPIKHQRCLGHNTKRVLDASYKVPAQVARECKLIKMNMESCKKCPQLQDNYGSKYTAFTGGCLDQLHAYWQATHPEAGESAIPGAKGCTVHR